MKEYDRQLIIGEGNRTNVQRTGGKYEDYEYEKVLYYVRKLPNIYY